MQDDFPDLARKAAERLAIRSGADKFFDLKLHMKYPELGISIAKSLAGLTGYSADYDKFFHNELQEIYPDIGATLAKSLAAEKNPIRFFELNLQDTYTNLESTAAEGLLEFSTYSPYGLKFFDLKLHMKYPELGIPKAKELVGENPKRFFELKLQDTYPKIGLQEAKLWAKETPDAFLAHKLSDSYPDLALPLAKGLVASSKPEAQDQIKFFSMGLHNNFPELARSAAESIAALNRDAFLKRKFYNLFPPPRSEGGYSLAIKIPRPQDFTRASPRWSCS